ncbi:MAG: WD40/YVTN/BNR-like repeat-containing protein [Planctomycetota bacterium]
MKATTTAALALISLSACMGRPDLNSRPLIVPQNSGSDASLRGLCAVNTKVAWASGSGGTYLRTVDGGKTWQQGQVPGAENLDFRDVQAFDSQRALLLSAGQPARIYGTKDGGSSFTLLYEHADPAAFFDAMAFWNQREGIAFSDPVQGKFLILRTSNGGENWWEVPSDQLVPPLASEAGFAASGTCAAVGPGRRAWIGTGGGAARVLRSVDGGRSWTAAATPLRQGMSSAGIFSLAFRDSRRGIAVGGNYQDPPNPEGNIAISDDGGASWRPITGPGPRGYRSCVAWVPQQGGNTVFAIGRSGSDFSRDGGESWQPCSDDGYFVASFAADGSGWVAGANGRIARVEWR